MLSLLKQLRVDPNAQFARYIINGVLATLVHFSVLSFNLKVLHFSSAGLANAAAAIFGIATSFVGSRYFVFPHAPQGSLKQQMFRFAGLYCSIAILHGLILYLWTDTGRLDYRVGFCIATFIQVTLSYFGNKKLVFKV